MATTRIPAACKVAGLTPKNFQYCWARLPGCFLLVLVVGDRFGGSAVCTGPVCCNALCGGQ